MKILNRLVFFVLISAFLLVSCTKAPADKALDSLDSVLDTLEQSLKSNDADALGKAIAEVEALQKSISGSSKKLTSAQSKRAEKLLVRSLSITQDLIGNFMAPEKK